MLVRRSKASGWGERTNERRGRADSLGSPRIEKGQELHPPVRGHGSAAHAADGGEAAECQYWPREALEDVASMPAELSREQILNTVSWMARGRRLDRVVALDEFDQETAAA